VVLALDSHRWSRVQFTAAAVSKTGTGDDLRAGKPPQYFSKPPRPTQPPTLSVTGNEYQPKCGDALRLGSKGRYGSFHLWINVWVTVKTVCDPLLTRAIPERQSAIQIRLPLPFTFTMWFKLLLLFTNSSIPVHCRNTVTAEY